MSRDEDTEALVREFRENPGAEAEDLEFKSKEILESTEQKKKVVRILSSMANRDGGTMIIGVRHEDEAIKLQRFEPETEARQTLTHVAQEYTKPSLPNLWNIQFDDCLGERLLRIDVHPSNSEVVQFHYDGEYRAYIREEDGMREMSTGEVADFYENIGHGEMLSQNLEIDRPEFLSFTPEPVGTEFEDEAFGRAITRSPNHHTVIYGSGVLEDRLRKSLTYSLGTSVPSSHDYYYSATLLKKAEEYLGASLNRSLGYTIRRGDVQLTGSGVGALIEDLQRLQDVNNYLKGASNSEWGYGPVLAGYARCDYGILWFEVQQEGESFNRWNLELILPDIPFENTDVKSFFTEIGHEPNFYSHKAGLQYIYCKGRGCGPLRNPKPLDIREAGEVGTLHVMVDNPFFDWPESFQAELESPLPDWCSRSLGPVPRMPFQVAGGYVEDEPDKFSLNYFTYRYVSGTHPTILVDNSCWQR